MMWRDKAGGRMSTSAHFPIQLRFGSPFCKELGLHILLLPCFIPFATLSNFCKIPVHLQWSKDPSVNSQNWARPGWQHSSPGPHGCFINVIPQAPPIEHWHSQYQHPCSRVGHSQWLGKVCSEEFQRESWTTNIFSYKVIEILICPWKPSQSTVDSVIVLQLELNGQGGHGFHGNVYFSLHLQGEVTADPWIGREMCARR